MSERVERTNSERMSHTERLVRLDPETGSLTSDCFHVNFRSENVTD